MLLKIAITAGLIFVIDLIIAKSNDFDGLPLWLSSIVAISGLLSLATMIICFLISVWSV